jgi:hypothetical protein
LPDRVFRELPTTVFQTAAFDDFDRKTADSAITSHDSGHTREKHRQNLGALLARVVRHCGFAGASGRATRVLS